MMFSIMILISCGVKKNTKHQKKAYQVVNSISDNPFILIKDSYYKNSQYKDLPDYFSRNYFLMLVSLDSKLHPEDIRSQFSKADFEYMQKQSIANGVVEWNSEFLKRGIEVREKPLSVTKENVLEVSYPVFSLNGNYAVVRIEGKSGYLLILKYVNNEWIAIASILVWIS